MGYEEETPQVIKTLDFMALVFAALIFAAICALVWIASDAQSDVETIAKIEQEAHNRKIAELYAYQLAQCLNGGVILKVGEQNVVECRRIREVKK